ncbi:NACHT, LRR and PYD domains-containing protein 12-like [Alosa alosa]|uniref:NACHT, LRR and PYD domains-containing protein 12-like n=1 Tax=Alosa alosa TaxID=278164 RepID=UPI00201551EF|nr:NACHT, LRR and PYD domains-containing protein 12-like [Alosa alosa]
MTMRNCQCKTNKDLSLTNSDLALLAVWRAEHRKEQQSEVMMGDLPADQQLGGFSKTFVASPDVAIRAPHRAAESLQFLLLTHLLLTQNTLQMGHKPHLNSMLLSPKVSQPGGEEAVARSLKASLALQYARIFEGSSTEGRARRVDDVYTELLVVDEYTGGALRAHEAQWMEQNHSRRSTCRYGPAGSRPRTAPHAGTVQLGQDSEPLHTQVRSSWVKTQNRSTRRSSWVKTQNCSTCSSSWIQCNDIFRAQPDSRKVLTLGVAGVGKTVSVHKFILDWAEGRANQDVAFLFPLPFRQLNVKSKRNQSLLALLQQSFLELKQLDALPERTSSILFVFDGLDESRFQLDLDKELISDPTEPASLDVLLASLISGHMLPDAYVWVTSRPAAVNQISRHFHQVTEVQGFTDEQKERYFKKNTSAPTARRIIAHMRKTKTLHVMCQLPVFCWILSVVLEEMWNREGEAKETTTPSIPSDTPTPSTLTEIYTRFLLYQLGRRSQKTASSSKGLLDLGKLAFLHLEKRKLIFDTADLRSCGLDDGEGSEFSATCTQIFKEETADLESRLYSFLHLSLQEYLAALFVLHGDDADGRPRLRLRRRLLGRSTLDAQKAAVERALRSEDGHLDLFLRFLLGLSLESNQRLLRRLLPERGGAQVEPADHRIVQYLHRTIREQAGAERSINLFHCLSELRDESLVLEVSRWLDSGKCRPEELTQTQWSALGFLLLTAEETQVEFELQRYWGSHKGLKRLLPVVRNTQRALLTDVGLSGEGCDPLVSALRSKSTHLRELDLSRNYIRDSGANQIALFLKDPSCKLEKLCLVNCGLSDVSCGALASALQSNPSHMKELDLSENPVGDQGMKLLRDILTHPQSHLEKLRLRDCGIREGGVSLTLGPAPLRELDLSKNLCADSALLQLSTALQEHLYKLQILRLGVCRFNTAGCGALARALRLNPSFLQELDLGRNKVGDSGLQLLSMVLKQPQCSLKRLRLKGCGISHQGMAALCSALQANPSHLIDLNMNCNNVGDLGIKHLSGFLKDPHCTLERLGLRCCSVGVEGCADLAAALSSNPTHLRWLNLNSNNPGDAGVKLLARVLKDPRSQLERLGLMFCGVRDEGWCTLVSALSSHPSHLRELTLTGDQPGSSGIRQTAEFLENPLCKLNIIRLSYCGIEAEACSALAASLLSHPSAIRELGLSHNSPGDAGAASLASLIKEPRCKLETLWMKNCGIEEAGFVALATALRSNPSHLQVLNLSSNDPGEAGVKELAKFLKEPHCQLEILRLNECGIRREGCVCVVSALRSNPLHLQELSLLQNNLGDICLGELLNDPHYRLHTLQY